MQNWVGGSGSQHTVDNLENVYGYARVNFDLRGPASVEMSSSRDFASFPNASFQGRTLQYSPLIIKHQSF